VTFCCVKMADEVVVGKSTSSTKVKVTFLEEETEKLTSHFRHLSFHLSSLTNYRHKAQEVKMSCACKWS